MYSRVLVIELLRRPERLNSRTAGEGPVGAEVLELPAMIGDCAPSIATPTFQQDILAHIPVRCSALGSSECAVRL